MPHARLIQNVFVIALVLLARPALALELVYVHDPACPYCRQWDRVIGPIYGKSEDAKHGRGPQMRPSGFCPEHPMAQTARAAPRRSRPWGPSPLF
jgi:hypothetical protein